MSPGRQGWQARFYRQTHCRHSPGPVFQEGFGTWEKVYLWDVTWERGLGQEGAITEHSVKCSGASFSTTPPRDWSRLHTHTLARFSSPLCKRQGWERHCPWVLVDALLCAVGKGSSVGCQRPSPSAGCLFVPAFPGCFLRFLSALEFYDHSWI